MRFVTALVAVLGVVGVSTTAQAQVIGTFSWQMQPHCNVITLTVVQQGGLFQLTGVDNLCGAGAAPVTGTAVPNAGGTVTLGFMITQGGAVAHVSADVSLSTLSGTWRDASGAFGAFAFGANSGGPARPTPVVTLNAVTGGNGEGLGGSVCSPGALEIITRNPFGVPTDARFSFVVPEHSHGQIRETGSIRNSTPNLTSVQHPGPGLYCLVFSAAPTQVQAESTVVSIHAGQ